jgi:type IV secretory pathway component VirB8
MYVYSDEIIRKEIYYSHLLSEKLIIYFDKEDNIIKMEKEKSILFIGIIFLACIAVIAATYILMPIITYLIR